LIYLLTWEDGLGGSSSSFFLKNKNKYIFNLSNNIIPHLSDVWLNKSEKQMKKTLKTIILEEVPAKCDI